MQQASQSPQITGCPPSNQRELFLERLFGPMDIVQIKAVQSWQNSEKRGSRVLEQAWFTPSELCRQSEYFSRLNREKGANLYFSVCPRRTRGSSDVTNLRCLWADIDHREPFEVLGQLPSVVPPPSLVVASGHGTHLYWKLSTPLDVSGSCERVRVENLMRFLYDEIHGDAVQDVTRFLRLPGFWNVKNCQNGIQPTACELTHVTGRSYSLSDFSRWDTPAMPIESQLQEVSLPDMYDERTRKRIAGLLQYLGEESPDRSRRDFGVVCGLLRLGVTPARIRQLVSGHSKFADHHRTYLERTLANACRAVGVERRD